MLLFGTIAGAMVAIVTFQVAKYFLHDKKQKWYRKALPHRPIASVSKVNPDGTAVIEFARKTYLAVRVESFEPMDLDHDPWLEGLASLFPDRPTLAVQTTGGPSHHGASNKLHRVIMVEAPSSDATTYGTIFETINTRLETAGVKTIPFDASMLEYAISHDWHYAHFFGIHLNRRWQPAARFLHVPQTVLHTVIVSLLPHQLALDLFVFRPARGMMTEGERKLDMQNLDLLRNGPLTYAAAFPDDLFQQFSPWT